MDKKTHALQVHQKQVFCSIRSIQSLVELLKIDKRKLQLLCQNPPYKNFKIPKKGGGERKIEDPQRDLKQVHIRLNKYLQSVYYLEKSRAAYGFIVGVRNDDDRRNVVSNARQHIKKDYLLNIDLKDFFHSVTREKVLTIFANKPFSFRGELADILADLTTYNGRLAMGAPTSPVLSNLACREMDQELIAFSSSMLWAFTRYADDMSFSSNQLINAEKINSVRAIVRKHGFIINEKKLKIYGPKDQKIVTGLLVTDKVTLAPDFLPELKSDIEKLKQVVYAQNEQGQFSTKWVDKLKLQIRGRLNFAGFVLRRNNQEYIELKDRFFEATNPPNTEFGSVSWRGFPYNL